MRKILPSNINFFFGKYKKYFGVIAAFIVAVTSIGISYFNQKQQTTDPRSNAATTNTLLTGIPNQGPSRFEPDTGMVYYGIGTGVNFRYDSEQLGGIKAVYDIKKMRPRILSGWALVDGQQSNDTLPFDATMQKLAEINTKEGNYYIMQLGIQIWRFVDTTKPDYEKNIFPRFYDANEIASSFDRFYSGQYDANLRNWGAKVKAYGKPMFIRPLYEMNEGAHGDELKKWVKLRHPNWTEKQVYDEARFKSVEGYRKVVDLMKAGAGGELPNVSWIWHVLNPISQYDKTLGSVNLISINSTVTNWKFGYWNSWYPGNRYVDWVGDSWYGAWAIPNDSDIGSLSKFSTSKGLPFMVVESSPTKIGIGPEKGIFHEKITTNYFDPYFQKVYTASNKIKGFSYYNYDWSNTYWAREAKANGLPIPPDARIQSNPNIIPYFAEKVANAKTNVPLNSLRIGYKPFEGPGITAGWQSSDNIYHIISKDNYWELNVTNSQWLKATKLKNIAPFNSAPAVTGSTGTLRYKPWENGGVTATYLQVINGINYLNVISKDRMYIYNYSTKLWQNTDNYFNTNPIWKIAPVTSNNLKPWQGAGITAAWIQNDNILRVVSKNVLYKFNRTTGQWDTSPQGWGAFPFGNTLWQSVRKVDGQFPWEGIGVTAGWMKDNRYLQLKSKDRYWELDTLNNTWTEFYGNYKDQDNTSVWKKSPFIELDGYYLPSNNPTATFPPVI